MDRTDSDTPNFDPPPCAGGREAAAGGGNQRPDYPATGDRGPSAPERVLVEALQGYRRSSGRDYLTWREVLEVARGLAAGGAGG